MRWLTAIVTGAAIFAAPFLWAADLPRGHDVYVLGEIHDNPSHHTVQADAVRVLAARAVVFEMLTPDEAARLADIPRDPDAMRSATAGYHWANIADYADILAASPNIIGAARDRAEVRMAFEAGAAAMFGPDAMAYGLTIPLPDEDQTAREDGQFAAHCNAMPRDLMAGMVEAQRLRDAAFARTVLRALDQHGAPVVLITGNGHARADWGVPHFLARVRPDLRVFALGQGEDARPPPGEFDLVTDAPAVERGDPCDAFK